MPTTVHVEIQFRLLPNDAFHALPAPAQARVREQVEQEVYSPSAVDSVLTSWSAVAVEGDDWGRVSEATLRALLERELARYSQARGGEEVKVQEGAAMSFFYCKVGDMWVCYPFFPLAEGDQPWILQDAGGNPGVEVAIGVQARWPV